jgi:hypothetical protein
MQHDLRFLAHYFPDFHSPHSDSNVLTSISSYFVRPDGFSPLFIAFSLSVQVLDESIVAC